MTSVFTPARAGATPATFRGQTERARRATLSAPQTLDATQTNLSAPATALSDATSS